MWNNLDKQERSLLTILCPHNFGLVVTHFISTLWYYVSNKTNWVGLIGIKSIAELGLSGKKTKVFSWYYVRAKTNRWWQGCIGRESPLAIDVDTGSLTSSERWNKKLVIQ